MRKVLAILAAVLFFSFATGDNAFAKGPIYDADHTFAQYFMLLIMPALVAGGTLVMIALYTRQNQKLAAK